MSQTALPRPLSLRHYQLTVIVLVCALVVAAVGVVAVWGTDSTSTSRTDFSGTEQSFSAEQHPLNENAAAARDTFVLFDWNSTDPSVRVVGAAARGMLELKVAKYAQVVPNLTKAQLVTLERDASGTTEVAVVDLITGERSVLSSGLPGVARSPVYMPRAIVSADGQVLYFVAFLSKLGVDARCDETRDPRDCDVFSVASVDLSTGIGRSVALPSGCASGIVFPTEGSKAGLACTHGAVYSLSPEPGTATLTTVRIGNAPQRSDPALPEQTWVLGAWFLGGAVYVLNSDGSIVVMGSGTQASVTHKISEAGWRPLSVVGSARQWGNKLFVPVARTYSDQYPQRLAVVDLMQGQFSLLDLPSTQVESIQPIDSGSLAIVASGRLYRWQLDSPTLVPFTDAEVGRHAVLTE